LPEFRDSSDRCRKRVIAPPTESLRWPEPPSSVGQIPLGKDVGCRSLRSTRPASADSLVRPLRRRDRRRPASRRDRASNRRPCAPQTGALSWVQLHVSGFGLRAVRRVGGSNAPLSREHGRGGPMWIFAILPREPIGAARPAGATLICRVCASRLACVNTLAYRAARIGWGDRGVP
jgi:hypothetical protein